MGTSIINYGDVGSCVTTSSPWNSPIETSNSIGASETTSRDASSCATTSPPWSSPTATSAANYEGVGSCVATSF